MPTGKEFITGLVGISIVSTLLVLLMLPLANTEWADNFRIEAVEGGESEGQEGLEGESVSIGVFSFVASFIKEAIFIGIPALITLAVLRLTRRRKKHKRAHEAVGV